MLPSCDLFTVDCFPLGNHLNVDIINASKRLKLFVFQCRVAFKVLTKFGTKFDHFACLNEAQYN
jgi:hypothetical protein